MEAEHMVDRYECEIVFEHANILLVLTANNYILNRWEIEGHFEKGFPLVFKKKCFG